LKKKLRKINFFEVVGSKFIGENIFSLRFWGQVVNIPLFFYKKILFFDAPCAHPKTALLMPIKKTFLAKKK